ncbi:MAG: hypothetical protein RJQ09_11460 [Cyclobacteriaceae bacterium]
MMPRLYFLLFVLAIATTSCDNDEASSLTIVDSNFENNVYTGAPGSVAEMTIQVNPGNVFEKFRFTKYVNNLFIDPNFGNTGSVEITDISQPITFLYELRSAEIGAEVDFAVQIVDKGLITTNDTITVLTVTDLETYGEMAFASLSTDTSVKAFLSIDDGQLYSTDDVAANPELAERIDLGFYYSDLTGPSFGSPTNLNSNALYTNAVAGWSKLNDTKVLLVLNLPNITYDEIEASIEIEEVIDRSVGPGQAFGGFATFIHANQYVIFETDPTRPGGKKLGIIEVTRFGTVDNGVEARFKVQKDLN